MPAVKAGEKFDIRGSLTHRINTRDLKTQKCKFKNEKFQSYSRTEMIEIENLKRLGFEFKISRKIVG